MSSVLVPRAVRFWFERADAPCVSVTTAITAATPITTPSVVNRERRRLAHRASMALPKLAPSIKPCLGCRLRCCRGLVPEGVLSGARSTRPVRSVDGCVELLIAPPLYVYVAVERDQPLQAVSNLPVMSVERLQAHRARCAHRETSPAAAHRPRGLHRVSPA